jgi:peptide/nickel transport system substrate-binding protein
MTVEVTTKTVDSFFPYQMLWFLVSSPAQYEKVGKDWQTSSPWSRRVPARSSWRASCRANVAELVRNPDYWDKRASPRRTA